MIKAEEIIIAREKTRQSVNSYFKNREGVIGFFLGGSVPARTADEFSDLDYRIIVKEDYHSRFLENKFDMPKEWGDWLFNEWVPNSSHCVSHYKGFFKVDVFYWIPAKFGPSPHYSKPVEIIQDTNNLIHDVIEKSKGLTFTTNEEEISRLISKILAGAHETYRRAKRNELFYAQYLFEELRQNLISLEFISQKQSLRQILKGDNNPTFRILEQSYVEFDGDKICETLIATLELMKTKIQELHSLYPLKRELDLDIQAIDVLRNE